MFAGCVAVTIAVAIADNASKMAETHTRTRVSPSSSFATHLVSAQITHIHSHVHWQLTVRASSLTKSHSHVFQCMLGRKLLHDARWQESESIHQRFLSWPLKVMEATYDG